MTVCSHCVVPVEQRTAVGCVVEIVGEIAHHLLLHIKFIQSLFSDFQFKIMVLLDNVPCEVFSLNGVKIADSIDNLPAGIYVVRQGNTAKKIAVK